MGQFSEHQKRSGRNDQGGIVVQIPREQEGTLSALFLFQDRGPAAERKRLTVANEKKARPARDPNEVTITENGVVSADCTLENGGHLKITVLKYHGNYKQCRIRITFDGWDKESEIIPGGTIKVGS